MRRRHNPLAATSGHCDGRPARLTVQNAVSGAPAAADRTAAAAAHDQRLTLDADRGTGHQYLRPVAERSPAARPTTLCQSKLSTVAVVRRHMQRQNTTTRELVSPNAT